MSSRRRRSRRNLYLIIVAVLASTVFLLLAVGAYPIALVNGRVIWASTYRSYVASALSYQQAARETYDFGSTSTLLIASSQGERALGRAALDELVEQQLIEGALDELVGEHSEELIENKIEDLFKEPQLPGASRALFQLDPDSFKEAILRPQATREVLAGRLFIDGKTLESWVPEARKSATVRLLSSTYSWRDSEVQAE